MKRLFPLLAIAVFFSSQAAVAECTLNTPEIDTQKLIRAPDITAFTLRNAADATVLLKDGRALYIHYSGCDSLGMQGVLWLPYAPFAQQQLPDFNDHDYWRQQILTIGDYLFDEQINQNFRRQLASKSDTTQAGDTTFNLTFSPQEAESYSVSAQKLPSGVMLTLEYIFRG